MPPNSDPCKLIVSLDLDKVKKCLGEEAFERLNIGRDLSTISKSRSEESNPIGGSQLLPELEPKEDCILPTPLEKDEQRQDVKYLCPTEKNESRPDDEDQSETTSVISIYDGGNFDGLENDVLVCDTPRLDTTGESRARSRSNDSTRSSTSSSSGSSTSSTSSSSSSTSSSSSDFGSSTSRSSSVPSPRKISRRKEKCNKKGGVHKAYRCKSSVKKITKEPPGSSTTDSTHASKVKVPSHDELVQNSREADYLSKSSVKTKSSHTNPGISILTEPEPRPVRRYSRKLETTPPTTPSNNPEPNASSQARRKNPDARKFDCYESNVRAKSRRSSSQPKATSSHSPEPEFRKVAPYEKTYSRKADHPEYRGNTTALERSSSNPDQTTIEATLQKQDARKADRYESCVKTTYRRSSSHPVPKENEVTRTSFCNERFTRKTGSYESRTKNDCTKNIDRMSKRETWKRVSFEYPQEDVPGGDQVLPDLQISLSNEVVNDGRSNGTARHGGRLGKRHSERGSANQLYTHTKRPRLYEGPQLYRTGRETCDSIGSAGNNNSRVAELLEKKEAQENVTTTKSTLGNDEKYTTTTCSKSAERRLSSNSTGGNRSRLFISSRGIEWHSKERRPVSPDSVDREEFTQRSKRTRRDSSKEGIHNDHTQGRKDPVATNCDGRKAYTTTISGTEVVAVTADSNLSERSQRESLVASLALPMSKSVLFVSASIRDGVCYEFAALSSNVTVEGYGMPFDFTTNRNRQDYTAGTVLGCSVNPDDFVRFAVLNTIDVPTIVSCDFRKGVARFLDYCCRREPLDRENVCDQCLPDRRVKAAYVSAERPYHLFCQYHAKSRLEVMSLRLYLPAYLQLHMARGQIHVYRIHSSTSSQREPYAGWELIARCRFYEYRRDYRRFMKKVEYSCDGENHLVDPCDTVRSLQKVCAVYGRELLCSN